MDQATQLSRAALMFLSRREGLKDVATEVPALRRIARRFIAGETLEEAVSAVKELNAREVVANAKRRGSFVRVDMEHGEVTQATLDVVRTLHREFGEPHVGAVLQSYLYRTEADARALCAERIRIRLCKGAYLEGPGIAYQDKKDVDENFLRVMRILLDSGLYHGIATHDERMIDETLAYARKKGLARGAFEFQMLYGIRRDLQERLAAEGHPVRVYVPYGKHWYPYFMRRLAERPANVWFVMKNLMKG
ncbi:MAG TPA: proline dehydrogenase family protein [Archangium sp.]|nr:proline dehydrogenase family protein [Archangium sp.]